jgi:hypothetical protein
MIPEPVDRLVRRLSRSVEAIHTLTYYTPEITRLTDEGFRGWWHAYFAYRAAPLGPVGAPVVAATFYNFAPRMVARAVPGVWDIMTPEAVLTRRGELVAEAVDRIWGDGRLDGVITEAADLARAALADIEIEARPLAAAHAALDWPDRPGPALWHACTIWREYRGDGHNIALAGAGIDGVEAHVLMAAHGRGNQATITGIRGWTPQEWAAATRRLADRGIVEADGSYTEAGRRFRSDIESATDDRSARPLATLGVDRATRLQDLLASLTADLLASGAVPGVWPPPTVLKG